MWEKVFLKMDCIFWQCLNFCSHFSQFFRRFLSTKNLPAICTLRWLCHKDVRATELQKWHRVFGELGARPKIRKEIVSELQMVFEFFSLCECCWWKLLVGCKTLIYCGQLCNNAVNYPSTPTIIGISTSFWYLSVDINWLPWVPWQQ
jgi:hypothetical protein